MSFQWDFYRKRSRMEVCRFDTDGVEIVRGALPSAPLRDLREDLGRFDAERGPDHPSMQRADPNALLLWHAPFMRDLLDLVAGSPLLERMREMVGPCPIVPLSHFCLRGVTDSVALDHFGWHQDYVAVNPDVPFNFWISLERTAPGEKSGLAFAAAMNDPAWIWMPSFEVGDVAVFSNRTPHTTTHYGSGIKRWSAELRFMAEIPKHMAKEPFALFTDSGIELRGL